jgi:pimeloyl-CoA dehydrogenase
MDFSLNDDHLALRDAVRRFCDGEYAAEHRGNPETPGQAAQRWKAMAELGLLGLPFPSDMGGMEQSAIEVMLVAQEFGRALGGGAFVGSTVMAGDLLLRVASEAQQRQWLPAMAESRLKASVALYEDGIRYDWQRARARAVETTGGYLLEGGKTLALHGDTADLLLVAARIGDDAGLSVFAVDAHTPGVQVRGFDTLDGRRAANIRFDAARVDAGRLLGARGAADDAIEAMLDAVTAALCAETVGAVEALLALTAEHLRTRKQFGAPLAKFQALQHRVADMAITLEQLKSMACAAAMAVGAGSAAQRRRLVSAAKALAGQQGRRVALDAIQMHGAMGMTDECRVGHYAKRLMVIGQLFGDASWHLRRMSAAQT